MTGCFNGSGNGGGTPPPDPMNGLTAIASKLASDEPKEIEDAIMLKSDIDSLFIGVEPVKIEKGDTVLDVINNLGGS